MSEKAIDRTSGLRQNPMVLAAVLLLVGVVGGWGVTVNAAVALGVAVGAWFFWVVAERVGWRRVANVLLALSTVGAGLGLWEVNQRYGESRHLARFCTEVGEVPVTLQGRVVVAPEGGGDHRGNLFWVCEGMEILTDEGWVKAAGTAQVKWRTGSHTVLKRGDVVEVYGWMRTTEGPANPGGMDERHRLGADRIFVELRIPRASGVNVMEEGAGGGVDPLARLRLFLREKLLEHTERVDVDAANTMVALVLGYRDPSMDDVSRGFADAGVSHLLAISGAHVVFIAWLVWALLRWVPMRPRWREILVAAVVLGYVLATPCGPPVVRAGVVVGMVLVTRMLGRPRQYLNMLAAAVVAVVIWRPADVLDAGFQLTFVCTAALILLGQRGHQGFFGRWLERQKLIVELADTRLRRAGLWVKKHLALVLTANIVGAITSIPLVMVHFNQVNLYGVVTGILAFPAVTLTMMAGLAQLALEGMSGTAAAGFAPVSTGMARGMVWWVEQLAALPGAAVGVRSPPEWVVVLLYVPLLLWAGRKVVRVSRAAVVNVAVAALVMMLAWYGWSSPVGALELQVLSVGQGSAVVMTTPAGERWVVDAGSRDQARVGAMAIAPALRVAGERRIWAMVLARLDTVHASAAGEVMERFRPGAVIMGQASARGWTLAAEEVDAVVARSHASMQRVQAGDRVELGHGGYAEVLWPVEDRKEQEALVMMLHYAGRRVLLMDSASALAMTLLPLNGVDLWCDAVVVLGPERGAADDLFRKRVAETGTRVVVWSGRTPWAPHGEGDGVVNAADGCVTLRVEGDGQLDVKRLR